MDVVELKKSGGDSQANSTIKPRDINKTIRRLHADREQLELRRDDLESPKRQAQSALADLIMRTGKVGHA